MKNYFAKFSKHGILNKTMKLFFIAKFFLPLALIITLLCGLVYISGQQILRQGANDPQIQIAEDSAARLESGEKPENIFSSQKIDISRSLAPFVIVYDKSGKVTFASGILEDRIAVLPTGVLADSRLENRTTWEPAEGVRIATVVVPYKNGYVLAGRSLREVEKREERLLLEVKIIWAVAIMGVGVMVVLFSLLYPNKKR